MSEQKRKPCPACGQTIVFIETPRGKWMPVDIPKFTAQKDDPEKSVVLDDGTIHKGIKAGDSAYISHFSTCTDPARFRRTR